MRMKGGCFSAVGKVVNSEPKEENIQKSAKSRRKWFRKKKRAISNTIQPETSATITAVPPVPILPQVVPPTELPKLSTVDKEDVKHAHTSTIVEPMKLSGVDKELTKHAYNVSLSIDKAVEIVVAAAPAAIEAECVTTADPIVDKPNEEMAATKTQTSFKGYKLSTKSKKRWFKKKRRAVSNKQQDDTAPTTTTVPPSPILPSVELPKLSGVDGEHGNHVPTTHILEPAKLSVEDNEASKHAHTKFTIEAAKLSGVDKEDSKHDYMTPVVEPVKLSGVDKGDSKHDNMTPIVEPVKLSGVDKGDIKHAYTTPIVESVPLSDVEKGETKQAYMTPVVEPVKSSEVVKEDSGHVLPSFIETAKPSGLDKENSKHADTNHIAEPKKLSGVGKEHSKYTHTTPIIEPKKLSEVSVVDNRNSKRVIPARNVEQVKVSRVDTVDEKNGYGVVHATTKAAEAVVSAAQTAVEVVRLSIAGRFADNSKEEMAAIKIQTAYRGYLARRRLRAIRGLMMLKSVMKIHAVKLQGSNTRRSMQRLAGMQSLFCEGRLSNSKGECGSSKIRKSKPWNLGN
ncbi:uncharacterized protein LOC141591089 [Silene latifolia]|uniref:uncharacterized protein LOC141591089 n=1 Tax=Silene latifolia TaxID=37657 RepID=UPI003D770254